MPHGYRTLPPHTPAPVICLLELFRLLPLTPPRTHADVPTFTVVFLRCGRYTYILTPLPHTAAVTWTPHPAFTYTTFSGYVTHLLVLDVVYTFAVYYTTFPVRATTTLPYDPFYATQRLLPACLHTYHDSPHPTPAVVVGYSRLLDSVPHTFTGYVYTLLDTFTYPLHVVATDNNARYLPVTFLPYAHRPSPHRRYHLTGCYARHCLHTFTCG